MGVPGGSVPIPASTAPMPYGIDGEGQAGLLCRMRLPADPERLAGHRWRGAVRTALLGRGLQQFRELRAEKLYLHRAISL